MEKLLKNKEVLLLAPSFFHYEMELVKGMEREGAHVTYLNNDPSNMFLVIKGVLEQASITTGWMVSWFEDSIARDLKNSKYDSILVVCGWAITSRISGLLRKNHLREGGEMILYYWDSLSLLRDDISRWHYYDRIYTFDRSDYEKHKDRLSFLPLFYINSYSKDNKEISKDYDLFTVGSFKFNRYYDIEEIREKNPDINVCSYMFDSKWVVRFHKLFRPKYKNIDMNKLQFRMLTPEEVRDYYRRSKAVLDIPRENQNGLTIRTFECLAMEKKMVTTNAQIQYYDFYNPENIYVMGSNKQLPNKEWFDGEYMPLSTDLYEKYSIRSWLKKVLGYE